MIDEIIYFIKHIFARMVCYIVGCDIHQYSDYNMPEDWTSPDYCKRCDACHDVYGFETTDFELIYPCETFFGRIKEAFCN